MPATRKQLRHFWKTHSCASLHCPYNDQRFSWETFLRIIRIKSLKKIGRPEPIQATTN